MEYITIAILGKPWGLQGDVQIYLHTDFPELRFKKGRKYILISPDKAEQLVHLRSFKMHGNKYLARFEEFNVIEQVEDFSGYELCLKKEDAPLPEGAYRFADLVGASALDQEGHELGKIIEVTDYAPTKNLKIQMEDKRCFYVPFLDQFVPEIDLENKKVTIAVVEGMLP